MVVLRNAFGVNTTDDTARLVAEQASADGMGALRRGYNAARIGTDMNAALAEEANARAFGNEEEAQKAALRAQQYAARQGMYAPEVGRVEDIRGPGDLLSWAGTQAGGFAGSVQDPLAMGLGGRLAGTAAFILSRGRAGGLGGLISQGAPAAGIGAGALYGQRQGTGEMYGRLKEDPEAMASMTPQQAALTSNAYGVAAGALGMVAPSMIARQAGGGVLAGNAARRAAGQAVPPTAFGSTVGRTMLTEGATEAGETALQQGVHSYINPNRSTLGDGSELLNSAASGFVGAGGPAVVGAGAQSAFGQADRLQDPEFRQQVADLTRGAAVDLKDSTVHAVRRAADKARGKAVDMRDTVETMREDGTIDRAVERTADFIAGMPDMVSGVAKKAKKYADERGVTDAVNKLADRAEKAVFGDPEAVRERFLQNREIVKQTGLDDSFAAAIDSKFAPTDDDGFLEWSDARNQRITGALRALADSGNEEAQDAMRAIMATDDPVQQEQVIDSFAPFLQRTASDLELEAAAAGFELMVGQTVEKGAQAATEFTVSAAKTAAKVAVPAAQAAARGVKTGVQAGAAGMQGAARGIGRGALNAEVNLGEGGNSERFSMQGTPMQQAPEFNYAVWKKMREADRANPNAARALEIQRTDKDSDVLRTFQGNKPRVADKAARERSYRRAALYGEMLLAQRYERRQIAHRTGVGIDNWVRSIGFELSDLVDRIALDRQNGVSNPSVQMAELDGIAKDITTSLGGDTERVLDMYERLQNATDATDPAVAAALEVVMARIQKFVTTSPAERQKAERALADKLVGALPPKMQEVVFKMGSGPSQLLGRMRDIARGRLDRRQVAAFEADVGRDRFQDMLRLINADDELTRSEGDPAAVYLDGKGNEVDVDGVRTSDDVADEEPSDYELRQAVKSATGNKGGTLTIYRNEPGHQVRVASGRHGSGQAFEVSRGRARGKDAAEGTQDQIDAQAEAGFDNPERGGRIAKAAELRKQINKMLDVLEGPTEWPRKFTLPRDRPSMYRLSSEDLKIIEARQADRAAGRTPTEIPGSLGRRIGDMERMLAGERTPEAMIEAIEGEIPGIKNPAERKQQIERLAKLKQVQVLAQQGNERAAEGIKREAADFFETRGTEYEVDPISARRMADDAGMNELSRLGVFRDYKLHEALAAYKAGDIEAALEAVKLYRLTGYRMEGLIMSASAAKDVLKWAAPTQNRPTPMTKEMKASLESMAASEELTAKRTENLKSALNLMIAQNLDKGDEGNQFVQSVKDLIRVIDASDARAKVNARAKRAHNADLEGRAKALRGEPAQGVDAQDAQALGAVMADHTYQGLPVPERRELQQAVDDFFNYSFAVRAEQVTSRAGTKMATAELIELARSGRDARAAVRARRTGDGRADTDNTNTLEGGMINFAQPKGRNLMGGRQMSRGEDADTTISIPVKALVGWVRRNSREESARDMSPGDKWLSNLYEGITSIIATGAVEGMPFVIDRKGNRQYFSDQKFLTNADAPRKTSVGVGGRKVLEPRPAMLNEDGGAAYTGGLPAALHTPVGVRTAYNRSKDVARAARFDNLDTDGLPPSQLDDIGPEGLTSAMKDLRNTARREKDKAEVSRKVEWDSRDMNDTEAGKVKRGRVVSKEELRARREEDGDWDDGDWDDIAEQFTDDDGDYADRAEALDAKKAYEELFASFEDPFVESQMRNKAFEHRMNEVSAEEPYDAVAKSAQRAERVVAYMRSDAGKRTGTMVKGKDADLVLFDVDGAKTIENIEMRLRMAMKKSASGKRSKIHYAYPVAHVLSHKNMMDFRALVDAEVVGKDGARTRDPSAITQEQFDHLLDLRRVAATLFSDIHAGPRLAMARALAKGSSHVKDVEAAHTYLNKLAEAEAKTRTARTARKAEKRLADIEAVKATARTEKAAANARYEKLDLIQSDKAVDPFDKNAAVRRKGERIEAIGAVDPFAKNATKAKNAAPEVAAKGPKSQLSPAGAAKFSERAVDEDRRYSLPNKQDVRTDGVRYSRQGAAQGSIFSKVSDNEYHSVPLGRIGPVEDAWLRLSRDEDGDISLTVNSIENWVDGHVLTMDIFKNDSGQWEFGVDGPDKGSGAYERYRHLFDAIDDVDPYETGEKYSYAKFHAGVFPIAELRALFKLLKKLSAELGVAPERIVRGRDTGPQAGRPYASISTARLSEQATTGKPSTDAEVAAAKKYLNDVLGNQIKAEFEEITGYSGAWIETDNLLRVSTLTNAGIMDVARHEALHAFFSKFIKGNPKAVRILKTLTDDPRIVRRLEALLKDDPEALKQLTDGEERLAYIYQFAMAGKLRLPASPAKTLMGKIRKFLRGVFNMISDDERASMLLYAFEAGKMRDPSAAGKAIANTLNEGTWLRRGTRMMDGVSQRAAALIQPAVTILNESASPTARALGQLLYTNPGEEKDGQAAPGYINDRNQQMRRFENVYRGVIEGLDDTTSLEAITAMQRQTPIDDIADPDVAAAVGQLRSFFERMHRYLSEEKGMRVGDLGKNYFPRVYDHDKMLNDPAAFSNMLMEHYRTEMESMAVRWNTAKNDYYGEVDDILYDARTVAEALTQRIIQSDSVDDEVLTAPMREDGVLRPWMSAGESRKLDFLKPEHIEPFLEKDLTLTLSRYVRQAVRTGEYTQRFGRYGAGLDRMLQRVGMELEDVSKTMLAEGDLKSEEDRKKWLARQVRDVGNSVGAMEGSLGNDVSKTVRQLNSWGTVYQNVRLLPLALFSSFVDPLGIVARGAEMRGAYDAFVRGIKAVGAQWADMLRDTPSGRKKDAWEQLAEAVGVIDQNTFNQLLNDEYGSTYHVGWAKRTNELMFKANGMDAWNRAMRVSATREAVKFIERHSKGETKDSARWMAELGLTPNDLHWDAEGELLLDKRALRMAKPDMDIREAERATTKLHQAINRWVEGAVLSPNAAQRPAWGSDPHYGVFWHLKQFAYSFHETIMRRAVNEAKHGNAMPLGVFAWYIPVMIASDVVKGLATGMGDLPNYMQGYDVGDWVQHGVDRSGVLGKYHLVIDGIQDPMGVPGPMFDQVVDIITEPMEKTFIDALPAHAVYERMI